MKELSSKALAVGASLMTASIIAGFSFIKDVESRLAIIEDDLGETVEVVGMLHPPSRASLSVESETFYADNKILGFYANKNSTDAFFLFSEANTYGMCITYVN